jgi:hypothetical protein
VIGDGDGDGDGDCDAHADGGIIMNVYTVRCLN